MQRLFYLSVILITLLSFSSSSNSPTQSDDILGEWYVTDKDATVAIHKKNGLYYGRIAWMAEPNLPNGEPKRDTLNPDKSKRNRLFTDYDFLENFEFDGQGTWKNGTIYNSQDGKKYWGQITLKDANHLVLRGYIGAPIFGRSVTWTRKR